MEVLNTMHRLEKDLECVAEGVAASCSCDLSGILDNKIVTIPYIYEPSLRFRSLWVDDLIAQIRSGSFTFP